jgi:hypothetical protein
LNAILTLAALVVAAQERAGLTTWDGRHRIDAIEVRVVYFVPSDRAPLPDWRARVDYFCRRIERFHAREFGGQSTLKTVVRPEPFRSARSTPELRRGDGDAVFFRTLREVDEALKVGAGERTAFPILLVLSDINWRALEDFYRLRTKDDGSVEFEGSTSDGRHFPGAESGGARATYLADRGVGWGLVSADGWRVPYRGTDCVVYHEGVGHSVGLPHPKEGNRSVMSLGQYHGWISESWIDDDQKKRLGWSAPAKPPDRRADLFSLFTALPDPAVPRPDEPVRLRMTWPPGARIASLRVRLQTDLWGPWVDAAAPAEGAAPEAVALGRFDRPTPVSYRVDATLTGGGDVELWGYFQVRARPDEPPRPAPQ